MNYGYKCLFCKIVNIFLYIFFFNTCVAFADNSVRLSFSPVVISSSVHQADEHGSVSAKPVRLVFVGDVMVHAAQLEIALRDGKHDFHSSFEAIRPWLKGDVVVGNLETVLGGADQGYSGYPRFNSPDSLAEALRGAGFTTMLFANNHTLDQGMQAARRTVQILRDNGLSITGIAGATPSPLLLEIGELRLGILNYTYGSNCPVTPDATDTVSLNIIDKDRLTEDVHQLQAQGAKYIVAALHWGEEYSPAPSAAQQEIAQHCLELGVDAVIGTHPHILQPFEVRHINGKKCLIAWSLGNFISSQRTLPRERSVILALEVLSDHTGTHLYRAAVAPIWVDWSRSRKVVRVLPATSGFFRTAQAGQNSLPLPFNPDTEAVLDKRGEHKTSMDKISPVIVDATTAAKLSNAEMTIRTFLELPSLPDEQGFYTIYEIEKNFSFYQ